jgi:hypothetical protein
MPVVVRSTYMEHVVSLNKHAVRSGADRRTDMTSPLSVLFMHLVQIKQVKQSRYKPGVAQRVPGS